MESVTFSYYDAVVYDAVYTLYRANCSKFALTDLLRVMSGDEKVRFTAQKAGYRKESRGFGIPWKNFGILPSPLTTVKRYRCGS